MRFTQEEYLAYKAKNNELKYTDDADEGKESKLDLKIARYIKDNGLYGFHDRSRGINKAGHPDWVIALPNGRTLWIESKAKKGRMSEEQKNNRLLLLALNHEFYVIRSFKRFLEVVNKKSLEQLQPGF
jgi:hypothetical protein